MRALLIVASLAVVIATDATAATRVFISPRSAVIPASGKVVLDVYWFNEGEAPAAIPGRGEYALMMVIGSRTGKGLPRVRGPAAIIDHKPADRRIAPRTLVRDDTITATIDAKNDEFVELKAEFQLAGGRRFESNTVILVKRR
jgi:hypothetical protein